MALRAKTLNPIIGEGYDSGPTRVRSCKFGCLVSKLNIKFNIGSNYNVVLKRQKTEAGKLVPGLK